MHSPITFETVYTGQTKTAEPTPEVSGVRGKLRPNPLRSTREPRSSKII